MMKFNTMNKFAEPRKVELFVYDGVRYEKETHEKPHKTVTYDNVIGFAVYTGEKARELENGFSEDSVDPYHEYLALVLNLVKFRFLEIHTLICLFRK